MSLRIVRETASEGAARAVRRSARPGQDWSAVVARMLAGDRAAYLRVARLVTGFLAHWGAYDFRDEWPDLVQEVLLAVIRAAREGRVEKPAAVVGYLRSIAHHKLMDRLRAHVRHGEDEVRPLERVATGPETPSLRAGANQDVLADVRRALERLPERKRAAVFGVYGEGKTYEQVAAETGIPLGSVKRYLREAMVALRREFAADLEEA
jgi:RNA polymerase sigma-70 factor (ECF subfamily)